MKHVCKPDTDPGRHSSPRVAAVRAVSSGVERSPTLLVRPGPAVGCLPHHPGDFPLGPALASSAPGVTAIVAVRWNRPAAGTPVATSQDRAGGPTSPRGDGDHAAGLHTATTKRLSPRLPKRWKDRQWR